MRHYVAGGVCNMPVTENSKDVLWDLVEFQTLEVPRGALDPTPCRFPQELGAAQWFSVS